MAARPPPSPPTETTRLDDLAVGASYVFTYAHNGYTYRLGQLLEANVPVRFIGIPARSTWKFVHEWRSTESAPGTYRMVLDETGCKDLVGTPRAFEIDREALAVGKRYAFHNSKTGYVTDLGTLCEVGVSEFCPEGSGRGGAPNRVWKFPLIWVHDDWTGVYILLPDLPEDAEIKVAQK